jgi:parvulin-like peptidyl-prolyl isomerase
MTRMLLSCVLVASSALAQTATTASAPKMPPSQATALAQVPPGPEQVPANATVVEIHGLCPGNKPANGATCTTTLTREQFDTMVAAVGISGQLSTPAAKRNLATGYAQVLAMADAAEKAGIEKDPNFQELMKIVRIRTLAQAYRHSLEQKYSSPSPDEVSAYYNQNIEQYQQLRLDRIFIPRVNPKVAPSGQTEFAKKAEKVAQEIRERAAAGEDVGKLQKEASATLGLIAPATTDIGPRKKGSLPPMVEPDVFALKSGEVTKVENEPSGFNIYKLRSKDTLPLAAVHNQIVQQLQQKNMEAELKKLMDGVHTDLNEQFFNTRTAPPAWVVNGTRSATPIPPPIKPPVAPGGAATQGSAAAAKDASSTTPAPAQPK